MIITHSDIKQILKHHYPILSETLILDEKFINPPLDFMTAVLQSIRQEVSDLKYKSNMFDCDDFALVTNAKVHLYRMRELLSLPNKDPYQYAFGEAVVKVSSKLMGVQLHMINLFIDDRRQLYFSEPQAGGEIWTPSDPDNDVLEVLHVRI